MPHQILLRQLTRKLRPGTLAGFWQGRYTLQPWNEVANSAYSQPPVPQGQTWDAGADFGFAAHQHITNPSTGLDSIYQKHVWSRLGTVEPPESSDTDGQAQAKALAAAAAFVTLQPAAAAAALQDDEENQKHRAAFPALIKPAALPAAIMPFIAEAPLADQQAADTEIVSIDLSAGLSTIQEEPEEASVPVRQAAPTQAGPSAVAEAQASLTSETLPAADTEPDRGEVTGSEATGTTASTSQATKLPESAAAAAKRHRSTDVASHETEHESASQMSAGPVSLKQRPAAEPAACSSEEIMQYAGGAAAKQLVPLPVLTALDAPAVSRRDPRAVLSAAMHAAHAVSMVQNGSPATASSSKPAATAVSSPGLISLPTRAERAPAEETLLESKSAAPLHSRCHTRAVLSPSSQISRAVPAISCPVQQTPFASFSRPKTFAGDSMVSRPITAAAAVAARSSSYEVQAKASAAAATGQRAVQTALPSQALKRKHTAVSAPAVHARRPTPNALRPVMAALELLLDADSIEVSGHISGFVAARGEVCGRPVHVCYLETDSIAPSSQPVVCDALCNMMDAAILVGCPVVTIYGSCPRSTTYKRSSASASTAAHLAAWMPAVQRHMDASGVVPQLAVSMGQLSTVSSLLASTCDFSFSQHGSRGGYRAAETCDPDCSSASQSGSCNDCSAIEHLKQHDSSSSSEQEPSQQQEPSSIACSSVEEALHRIRQLLAMLPSSNHAPAPKVPCHDPPWRLCSGLQHIQSPLDLCTRLADAGLVAGSWAAPGAAVCFGRLDCTTVGFVAMPCSAVNPGAHSCRSLAEVVRAVRFCNAFNLPIVSLLLLHDKGEGFAAAEGGTRMSDLANLIFAYSEAAVPKLAVVCGPGAASAAQCLKSDVTLLWTSNTSKQHRDQHESPGAGVAQEAWVSVPQCVSIRPEETRSELCSALEPLLESRLVAIPRRKHALLPKVC